MDWRRMRQRYPAFSKFDYISDGYQCGACCYQVRRFAPFSGRAIVAEKWAIGSNIRQDHCRPQAKEALFRRWMADKSGRMKNEIQAKHSINGRFY